MFSGKSQFLKDHICQNIEYVESILLHMSCSFLLCIKVLKYINNCLLLSENNAFAYISRLKFQKALSK